MAISLKRNWQSALKLYGKSLLVFAFVFLSASSHLIQSVHAQSGISSKRTIPLPTPRPEGSKLNNPLLAFTQKTPKAFPKENVVLRLKAVTGEDKQTIQENLVWRIFSEEKGPDGKLPLLGSYTGGEITLRLPAGLYLVHAAFGYAGLAKRLTVLPPNADKTFEIEAGGLRLNAAFRDQDYIPAKDLRFEVARKEGEILRTIVSDLEADELVRLAPGSYEVTSRYGTINSQVNAKVRVENNKITELTLFQRGAEITLKLVSEAGGEALANTKWTVLSPGGDTIVDQISSAFPSFVLAAGEYVAYANHEGEIHSHPFIVESGVHRDVEVVVKVP